LTSFEPFTLLRGGHRQTLGGVILRSFLRWRLPAEDVVVDGKDGVKLLLRASWQKDRRRPALLLVHGLEGCDSSSYMISTGELAFSAGWHVVRMNMRGCGDGLALCPRLYNAGLTADLVAVTRWLAGRVDRFAVCGFSLGANLTLLTVARERSEMPDALRGVVAVSPPLDMSECADELEKPSNRIYQFRFLRSLLASYRTRQRLSPELYHPGRERGLETLRAFDDAITAFYGGYDGAEDYYRSVSPGPLLEGFDLPTLVLASDNDPFIPRASVAKWAHSESVRVELNASGGHVGFAGRTRARGYFWAAERILSFASAVESASSTSARS
jgi:hypothetical protein